MPVSVKPLDKGDYVQVQSGVHAGKEGEVKERRRKVGPDGRMQHGDELIIMVETDGWSDEGTVTIPTSVDPLKCKLHPRPVK